MSEENNVCGICGGVKRVDWTISFEECHPVEMRFDPASLAGNWRLCPGHPNPAQKHDGKLGEDAYVNYYHYPKNTLAPSTMVRVFTECGELTPMESLSLLAWLKQEESELQRLAKEQDGK